MDPGDLRLAYSIPVFERSLQVAFQKIGGGQKVVGVLIARVEAQRLMQIADGVDHSILLEGHAGKFDRKTLVSWCESLSSA